MKKLFIAIIVLIVLSPIIYVGSLVFEKYQFIDSMMEFNGSSKEEQIRGWWILEGISPKFSTVSIPDDSVGVVFNEDLTFTTFSNENDSYRMAGKWDISSDTLHLYHYHVVGVDSIFMIIKELNREQLTLEFEDKETGQVQTRFGRVKELK
ncbi:MAG: hypothetical protein NXI20_27685 [bacterium]|nr:hypothetical protein [bacterium]